MGKSLRTKTLNQVLYISIGCVIAAVILFITLFTVFNKNNENDNLQISDSSNQSEINTEEASSSIGKTVSESEEYIGIDDDETLVVETNNQTDSELANSNVLNETEVAQNMQQVQEQKLSEQSIVEETQTTSENTNSEKDTPKDPTFVMPVDGEIVKQYGKEKLIYSETLKEWTTHLGIDIKADKTTIVKSSSDGCIKSIKNDPRYGLTIVIEHENGFTSVYSNLLTAEFVVVGENVKSGQTIGTVGNSSTFEILDEPHLHFEILKDGNSIDPEMYIK